MEPASLPNLENTRESQCVSVLLCCGLMYRAVIYISFTAWITPSAGAWYDYLYQTADKSGGSEGDLEGKVER